MDDGPTPFTFPDAQDFNDNWLKIAAHSQTLISQFLSSNDAYLQQANLDPMAVGRAFLEMTNRVLTSPQHLADSHITLWQDYMKLWQNATLRMMGGTPDPVIEPEQGDKRFRDSEWTENQVYDFIKQSYLLSARWMQGVVQSAGGDEEHDSRKLDFFTRQFIDAISPSNFALTNPEVMRETLASGGDNLVKGLQNLLDDLGRGQGKLNISQTDLEAFAIGENIATTPGQVIFRNELIELIQYEPATKTVYKRPLLVLPPWINKYYILDLKPQNSLVKWLTEQGYTTFIISWRNPDVRHAAFGFDDYMRLGPLAALDVIEQITGEKSVHALGYCIGGTLLACTLAWLEATGAAARIPAATFFVSQVDFSEAGELKLFVDDEQIANMQATMDEKGFLDGHTMATTFNMLRSNDLIWSFVINNYLMGKDPFPFDLLYWNSDSTRVTRAAHEFYLREMYQNNNLVKPGKVEMNGVAIDLSQIKIPIYIQAAETDHICPYNSVYKATQIYSGDCRFVLAGSGHIAGVVNPPSANKYYHYTNDTLPQTAREWLHDATRHPGSWWPDWHQWSAPKCGKKIPARTPANALEPAPGSYVKTRYG
ncbi:PHA/PHB synthase family protein [Govanella unica]|uniref:Class I poly(R)-hydroxyalkanoic acid synthase n=1 Tax=Govanella unica TaxID=2975056 RepID=A0A9X3Z7F6_9PROT|nr:class I poly(R)-hydroxyalkanoic acid synthase [Govania unica]MDA5194116.1 class I poly(R)-hydroxyalkanoic acid synthase [Govania unica]